VTEADINRPPCETVLASYKVPKRVMFVDDDQVTLTGSQKIREDELASIAARRLAAEDDGWGRYLRDEHPELLEAAPT